MHVSAAGYARGTKVDVARSRVEIDVLLSRHGASSVAILNDDENSRAAIAFTLKGARFRVELPLPSRDDVTPKKKEWREGKWIVLEGKAEEPRDWNRKSADQRRAWVDEQLAQGQRERWRAVLLLLKSKLEIVRLGLVTLEHEFMADMVLPNGGTVAEQLAHAIRNGLGSGDAPRLLGN